MQRVERLNFRLSLAQLFNKRAFLVLVVLSMAFQVSASPASAHYGNKIDNLLNLIQQGNHQEALKAINAAIAGDPYQSMLYCLRSDVYTDLHQYDKALKDINQAITLSPNTAFTYFTKGNCLARMGQFDEAVISFTQAIKLNPNDANSYAQRGNAYCILKKIDKAKADLDHALKLDPKNQAAAIGYVKLLIEADEFSAAISELTKFIKIDEKDAYLYAERSQLYFITDNLPLALNDINKAISLEKNSAPYLGLRGLFYALQNKFDLALKDFSRALELEPKDSHPLFLRGLAYALSKKCALALPDLNKYIALNPKDGRGYKARGYAYASMGESQKAITDFTKCLTLSPGSRIATCGKAIEYIKLQRFQEAIDDLDKWISTHPKDRGAVHLRELAQGLKYGSTPTAADLKNSFDLSTQELLGLSFKSESSEAMKSYGDSSKGATTLVITPAEKTEAKVNPDTAVIKPKTPEAPAEAVAEKKSAPLPEWLEHYLVNLERRVNQQWSMSSASNTETAISAHFILYPGGEASNIRITGEAGEIPEPLQAQIKNIIVRGAPYKPFDQANQLEVEVRFKGKTIHASPEHKEEKQ